MYLFRHGPVTAAGRGRLYGASDAEPEPLGVGVAWAGERFDALVTSDLRRARVAAAALFPGAPAARDPRLREIDYGDLDGEDLLALHARWPDLWDRWLAAPDAFRFPGGETFDEVMARAVAGVEAARRRAPDGRVAVVTHGGVIRAYVAWVLGATAHGVGRLRIGTLRHVEIRYWDGVPVIERVNA